MADGTHEVPVVLTAVERVAVVGANGGVGRRIVRRLEADRPGRAVAVVRKPAVCDALQASGAEIRVGDVTGELAQALDGADGVVFTAGSGGQTGWDQTLRVDLWGARRVIEAAEAAGIARFVMVSSIGAEAPLKAPEALQPYMIAKRAADDALEVSGLDWIILRPGRLTDDPGRGTVTTERGEAWPSVRRDDVAHTVCAALGSISEARRVLPLYEGDTPIEALFR